MSALFDQFMRTLVDGKVGEGLAIIVVFICGAIIYKLVVKYIL